MTPAFPSVVFDMPDAEYRAVDALSKHTLDWLAESPATFIERTLHPPKRTEAMRFGSLMDMFFLDRPRWDAEVVLAPDIGHKANAWKDFVAGCEANGQEYATPEDLAKINGMWDAVQRNKALASLIDKSRKQVSIFWIDEETGLRLKGRADMLLMTDGDADVMADLKSAESAQPWAFARASGMYRYHVQAAIYSDGWTANTGRAVKFLFAPVEKEPPYLNTILPILPDSLEAGRREYHRLLRLYQSCVESDNWPGLPEISDGFDVPKYSM